MSNYRPRNQHLLCADRRLRPLTWRNVAIFGAIAATAMFGVVSHLTDRFNAAGGFTSPALVAQGASAPQSVIRLATPTASHSGS
jgi:hypothetical protein